MPYPLPDICPEDIPGFLARRIRQEHVLSTPPTWAELLQVCRERGLEVLRSDTVAHAGMYLPEPRPVAVVGYADGIEVLAHELYHHLIHDNARHGIVYTYPYWREAPEEAAAQRFAELLVGEFEV